MLEGCHAGNVWQRHGLDLDPYWADHPAHLDLLCGVGVLADLVGRSCAGRTRC